jgi:ligand-binding sensor domain-containing protein
MFSPVTENKKIPAGEVKNFVYELSDNGPGLWLATASGAINATIPIDSESEASVYNKQNSNILSDSIFSIAVGRNNLRWFGTDKGISALYENKWLKSDYERKYPKAMFKDFKVTAMATTPDGDSLYVATEGAGVSRVFRNQTDAISGASEYAQWGPIEIPSDKVYSICITHDGTQWFGTELGVGKHTGYVTMENWTVYNTENGLVNNVVQSIAVDPEGKMWFGTKGGVSVFNGTDWISYTMADGLISNNILLVLADKNGNVYLGTDIGIMMYSNGQLVCYQ